MSDITIADSDMEEIFLHYYAKAAFGMDKINFGEFIGFFGVECGNVLGMGGALYAALLGISALAKEEREHTVYFLLQIEIAAITFGASAFIQRSGSGFGLGLAAIFYFMNIVSNLMDETKFLKYITPFAYTESSDIILDEALNGRYLAVGMVFTLVGIGVAFWQYRKKDIAS